MASLPLHPTSLLQDTTVFHMLIGRAVLQRAQSFLGFSGSATNGRRKPVPPLELYAAMAVIFRDNDLIESDLFRTGALTSPYHYEKSQL